MTPARSVAARVVALGVASAFTTPLPAVAHTARCATPGTHAAQSGAQLLRINRWEPGAIARPTIGGVGLGDARSVMIATGGIKSAGAARSLDGRVAGGASRNDAVAQQAPPANRRVSRQRIGTKEFGPVRTGGGTLTAYARWNRGLACANTAGEASRAEVWLTRITLTGGGNRSLIRVPEKFSAASTTGIRQRAGQMASVSTATLAGGRLVLADGDVRIRVARAATLRVSMSAARRGEVEYEPPVVEITTPDGGRTVLDAQGDHADITVGEAVTSLESMPSRIEKADPMPLPSIPGVPGVPSGRVPASDGPESGSDRRAQHPATMRISLGTARQATAGHAIAARVTAVRISLARRAGPGANPGQRRPFAVVADLGLGVLDAAAVAPHRAAVPVAPTGEPAGTGAGPGGNPATAEGDPGAEEGDSGAARSDSATAEGDPGAAGSDSATAGGGPGAGTAGLPITGPGLLPMLVAGASMVAGGVTAYVLSARRRRTDTAAAHLLTACCNATDNSSPRS